MNDKITVKLSKKAKDRITSGMKKVLKSGKNVFFDTHCHVFSSQDVPDGFLGIRLPFTEQFFSKISHFLHNVFNRSDRDKLSNIAYFIEKFKKNEPKSKADKLIEYYETNEKKHVIICPLMMDMTSGIKGNMKEGNNRVKTQLKKNQLVFRQLDDLKNLRDNIPEKILPFVSIDTNNELVYDIFNKAFSKEYNFFGIKVYPALGYLPSHPKLMDIFKVCAEYNIPVTAHAGGTLVHTTKKYIDNLCGLSNENGYLPIAGKDTKQWFFRGEDYRLFFNNPFNWLPVLNKYPNLRLNLGHFGSAEEWYDMMKGKNNTYPSRIMGLMERFENVYADISFNIAVNKYYKNKRLFDYTRKLLEDNKLIRERTLYGSDYYMVVMEGHFRSIKTDFFNAMGDELMKQIAEVNPQTVF